MNTDHHLYHADPTKPEELCPYCKAQRLEKKVAELEVKLYQAHMWKTRYLLVKGINAGLKKEMLEKMSLENYYENNDADGGMYRQARERIAELEAFCEQFINAYPDWRDKYELLGDEDE